MADCAVILTELKFVENGNAVLRAAANFEAERVFWTGTRVLDLAKHPRPKRGRERAASESAFDDFGEVRYERARDARQLLDRLIGEGYTPVAVELVARATSLERFNHPDKAVYVFGPEDGDLDTEIVKRCAQVVRIPSHGCLNVAMAAAVVLSHRHLQRLGSQGKLRIAR